MFFYQFFLFGKRMEEPPKPGTRDLNLPTFLITHKSPKTCWVFLVGFLKKNTRKSQTTYFRQNKKNNQKTRVKAVKLSIRAFKMNSSKRLPGNPRSRWFHHVENGGNTDSFWNDKHLRHKAHVIHKTNVRKKRVVQDFEGKTSCNGRFR